jgi:pimeloyl-ACP methyl ester carboxylesterase
MPNSLPILIVGGFGASWNIYQPFRQVLETVSNRPVFVTRLEMLDWLSVIVSDDYSNLLKRLHHSVVDTLRRTNAERLVLLGHSAGGILSRIYMGDQPYGYERLVFNGFQRVATLVTIGTPHTSPRRGRFGGLNQIAFVQEHYPGAYWRFIRYVSIISKSIFGVKNGTPQERNACEGYMMLTGECAQWGDGVVPLSCSTLAGAKNVVLSELRHDPRPDERVWYGHNEHTVRSWWEHVEQAEREPVAGTLDVSSVAYTTEDSVM